MSDSYLEKIVECPKCHKGVKYGNMIWLNGECLCPQCYDIKRAELDKFIKTKNYKEV